MGMDIDFIAGTNAIDKLQEYFNNKPHGEREKIAGDIIAAVDEIIAEN